jgi:hypothetical protein
LHAVGEHSDDGSGNQPNDCRPNRPVGIPAHEGKIWPGSDRWIEALILVNAGTTGEPSGDGGAMAPFEGEITVDRSKDEVFDFVADESNEPT